MIARTGGSDWGEGLLDTAGYIWIREIDKANGEMGVIGCCPLWWVCTKKAEGYEIE